MKKKTNFFLLKIKQRGSKNYNCKLIIYVLQTNCALFYNPGYGSNTFQVNTLLMDGRLLMLRVYQQKIS